MDGIGKKRRKEIGSCIRTDVSWIKWVPEGYLKLLVFIMLLP